MTHATGSHAGFDQFSVNNTAAVTVAEKFHAVNTRASRGFG